MSRRSPTEIVGQLMLFLVAGYETTANCLSYLFHHLARDARCQQKLRDELLEVVGEGGGELSHELCAQLKFMELCIKETLRLYPLASL